jgi:hypothetical protein
MAVLDVSFAVWICCFYSSINYLLFAGFNGKSTKTALVSNWCSIKILLNLKRNIRIIVVFNFYSNQWLIKMLNEMKIILQSQWLIVYYGCMFLLTRVFSCQVNLNYLKLSMEWIFTGSGKVFALQLRFSFVPIWLNRVVCCYSFDSFPTLGPYSVLSGECFRIGLCDSLRPQRTKNINESVQLGSVTYVECVMSHERSCFTSSNYFQLWRCDCDRNWLFETNDGNAN